MLLSNSTDVNIRLSIVLFFVRFVQTCGCENINVGSSFSGLKPEEWIRYSGVEIYSVKSSFLVDIQNSGWTNRWHCVVPFRATEDGWRRSQLLRNFQTWYCLLREVNDTSMIFILILSRARKYWHAHLDDPSPPSYIRCLVPSTGRVIRPNYWVAYLGNHLELRQVQACNNRPNFLTWYSCHNLFQKKLMYFDSVKCMSQHDELTALFASVKRIWAVYMNALPTCPVFYKG